MNMLCDHMETLDSKEDSFGGALVRAFLWAIVFGELILIVGVHQ